MSAPAVAPVRAGDLVADVLARDEVLIEVFARTSPHFNKLRSRTLRRVMARLVTVAQAARIAGVSTGALLEDLNGALGLHVPAAGDDPAGAPALQASPRGAATLVSARPVHAPEVELDVRDEMRRGREPFSRIMAAVAGLGDAEVLRLHTIFEPVPLFGVMAKRGFAYEASSTTADDWTVWFWRAESEARRSDDASLESASGETGYVAAANEQLLDVRQLEPPEPMLRTLAALETLPPGMVLVQINRRLPQFLFPILAERGFACTVDDSQPERVLVRVWHPA